jgi:hypothetical protein
MGFEVPPTRVSRSSNAPVLAGLALTAVLLLAAVVFAGHRGAMSSAAPSAQDTTALAHRGAPTAPGYVSAMMASGRKAPAPSGIAAGGAASVSPPVISSSLVQCHNVAPPECLRVARSAAGLFTAGSVGADAAAIAGVEVWGSLICGDNLECPSGRLLRLDPLGSAAVALSGNAGLVWVNVGERAASPGEASARRPLEAWIVQWFR